MAPENVIALVVFATFGALCVWFAGYSTGRSSRDDEISVYRDRSAHWYEEYLHLLTTVVLKKPYVPRDINRTELKK